MRDLILRDIVTNSSSNDQGVILFNSLEDAFLSKETLVLHVDASMSMSSSFLNSSIGEFLDKYGIQNFKDTVKFKGSKNQFARLADYIKKYSALFIA